MARYPAAGASRRLRRAVCARALHLVEKATTFPAYGATMTNVALDRDTAPAPVFQGCRLLGKAKDATFKW